MALRCILLTYQCLHFAYLNPNENPLPLQIATDDELWNTPTSEHITTNKPCMKSKCSKLTPRKLRARARYCIENIGKYLSATTKQYIILGNRYHQVISHARAENADEVKCRLAHKQFGIETRQWEEEPFFQRWLELHHKSSSLGWAIESLDAHGIEVINHCHGLIGRIEGDIQMLVKGVRELEAYWKWHRDWMEDLVKPKKAAKVARFLRPMRVFERAVLQRWRARTEGLRDRFCEDESEWEDLEEGGAEEEA